MWATEFAGVTLTVAYCAVVVVSVVIQLVHKHIALKRLGKGQNLIEVPAMQRHEFLRMAARVVRRMLQFPVMIFVGHALEVIYGMVTLSRALRLMRENMVLGAADTPADRGLDRLYLASHVMLGMEGVITLLFLPLEPPIRLMLRTMYLRRRAELSRLGTIKSLPRRRISERWPSARPPRTAPSPDALTLASFQMPPDCAQPVLVDQAAGATLDVPPDLPRLALPPSIASRSIGGESGLAQSVVVDHVVTHVRYADDQVSAAEQKPAPLRRLTVKWARRLQGKEPAETPPPRPPPLPQRAQTLAELPWDIVA
ncbi:hypothetical protein IWQ56_007472, partial [Coemansia nantahalensis]